MINADEGVFFLIDGQNYATREIRFKLVSVYGDIDINTGLPIKILQDRGQQVAKESVTKKFTGLLLQPSIPYVWAGKGQDELLAASQSDFPS